MEMTKEAEQKVLIIEINGQKFIGVPVDAWEAMKEELAQLRIKSESYDTYLESHGKVWFGKKDKDALIEGLEEMTPEQEEHLMRRSVATNPENAKAVPYTFQMANKHESLLDRFKPICDALVAEDFEKATELIKMFKEGRIKPEPTDWTKARLEDVPVDWMPKKGESFWIWNGEKAVDVTNIHPREYPITARLFPTKYLAEAYRSTLKAK